MTASDGMNVTATDEANTGEESGRTTGQKTWADAVREVGRSARRHRVLSALIALCVAGSLAAIGLSSGQAGQPGQPAPVAAAAFSLPALGQAGQGGQQVALSGYRGQPLIVNFFASWCEPCQRETPLLAAFYRTEKGKVAVVGLDENDVMANATTFTSKEDVRYPVGWDPGGAVATAYGVNALPQTFFLNAKHQVVDRVFGAVTLDDLNHGIALATAKK